MANENLSEGVPAIMNPASAPAQPKKYMVSVQETPAVEPAAVETQNGGKLRRKSNKKRKYNKRKVNSHKKRKPKRKSRKSLRRL